MYKKTFTYTDFNGNSVTEDAYFNLTRTEIMTMDLEMYGGFAEYLTKIVNTNDAPKMTEWYRKFIRKCVGIKSDDGRRFMKSEAISDEFEQTPMYDQLFIELTTDKGAAAEFIDNIIPAEVRDTIAANRSNESNDDTDPLAVVSNNA